MASKIIKCPSCGKHSTVYSETASCWGCDTALYIEKVQSPPSKAVQPAAVQTTRQPLRKRQSDGPAMAVAAIIILAIPALFLVQCTSITQSRDERALDAKRAELERMTNEQASNENACFQREIELNQARGKQALAEWDTAAASNLKNVSTEQEWEIRKSLGRELGLAPSEVNGWKDIYRSRAEAAARSKSVVQDKIAEAQEMAKQVCDWRDQSRQTLNHLKAEVSRLEVTVQKQSQR